MKKQLIVVIQEGAISAIVSDSPNDFQDVEVISVNYDCDVREDVGLKPILQPDGMTELAFVGRVEVEEKWIALA